MAMMPHNFPATEKMSLKLVIDTKGRRVLLAETGKDVVDFLFDIFSLPVGVVANLLPKKSMIGCLGNLYGSIEDLNVNCMRPNVSKNTVLNLNMSPLFYLDEMPMPLSWSNIVSSPATRSLCKCGLCDTKACSVDYVKEMIYTVTDDLVVEPKSISSLTLLNRIKATDANFLEEKMVTLSDYQGLQLLNAALQSTNVLTEVFLGKEA